MIDIKMVEIIFCVIFSIQLIVYLIVAIHAYLTIHEMRIIFNYVQTFSFTILMIVRVSTLLWSILDSGGEKEAPHYFKIYIYFQLP